MSNTLPGAEAYSAAEEGLALFQEINYKPGIAQALNAIGECARIEGQDSRAKQVYQECQDVCEHTGDIRLLYTVLHNRSFISQHEGNHQEAIDLLLRSLAMCREMNARSDMAMAMQAAR